MSHTPGPWEIMVSGYSVDVWACQEGGCRMFVASLVEARFCEPPSVALHVDVIKANARLIAAAPDLLEACKAGLTFWGPRDAFLLPEEKQALSLMEAAIQKAEAP